MPPKRPPQNGTQPGPDPAPESDKDSGKDSDAKKAPAGKSGKKATKADQTPPEYDQIDPDSDPENSSEAADLAQPEDENCVPEDMASAALNPGMDSGFEFEASAAVVPAEGTLPPEAASWANTDWAKLTDAEIMLRVSAGDEAGFDLLIAKYRRPIVHYMFRMVHNQAIAEELAQEVFLRVYRSRATYRAEARFSTWLYRIATNLGVNHARDHKQERAANNVYLDAPDAETGSTPDVSDGSLTAEQMMLRDERMNAIRAHVMALPERQRNAVLMHKYQEMDYKQIGDVLQLSESATKSLLFRAYQTLRDRLKDYL